MNRRRIIIFIAVLLTVSLPYWSALPLLVSFLPAQAMFGALAYLLEILLMVVMVMAVVEGRIRLMIAAAVLGFILGVAPGLALLPLAIFLPFFLKAIVPAMVMGLLINRGWRAGKSFVAAAILMAAFVLMIFAQSGQGLSGQVEELYSSIENMVAGPMAARGYDAEAINSQVDRLILYIRLITRILPGMIIMSGIGQLFVAFLLTDWHYTQRDSYFPGFGPFIYWKLPEKLLYLLGAILLIRLTVDGAMEVAADNAILILSTCYAVCGLALIEHLLRRLRMPGLIRAIFYIGFGFGPMLLLLVPPSKGQTVLMIASLMAIPIIGLFDSFFDFRKVRAHTLG